MRTAEFDYTLPAELIAQTPAVQRDASRLLVLDRTDGAVTHRQFRELPEFLREGDVLVLNNSRVIPARLRGVKAASGGAVEILLLEENATNDWWVMLKPGKRVRPGTRIEFAGSREKTNVVTAIVMAKNDEGHCRLEFSGVHDILESLESLGDTPIPPYIRRDAGARVTDDAKRYQTVFAQPPGSVAAPTAGLHFTQELLDRIRAQGVRVCFVTLHVGLGTFAPVKAASVEEHLMHEERFSLGAETAREVNAAKREARRVVAVGTTTVRVLETVAAQHDGRLVEISGRTRIFIHPPFGFRVVHALLTNFHLPQSTLLMLVSAFASPGETCGRERVLRAYAEAVRERYRFFSYGDAMLVL